VCAGGRVFCVWRVTVVLPRTHTPPLNSIFPRCACARDASVLSAGCAGVVPKGCFLCVYAHLRVPAAPVANRAHLRLQLCISSQLLLAGANCAHLLPTLPCILISVSVRAFCAARR
jgi:hypothetical protein